LRPSGKQDRNPEDTVWCKEDAGLDATETIPFGIAVTIEMGIALPVYDDFKHGCAFVFELPAD
jgi:hypothetical protein